MASYGPANNVAPVLFIACIAALLLCKGSLSIGNHFCSVTAVMSMDKSIFTN